MLPWLEESWPVLSSAVLLGLSLFASGHALLHKREVRASIGWVGIVWLVPGLGALLYFLLGINRIARRAAALRGESRRFRTDSLVPPLPPDQMDAAPHLVDLARLVARVTTRPLLPGNRVTPLVDGDEAYPAMLEAIESAERSVTLMTYIFDSRGVGARFVDALVAAQARGVQVRVLIDAVGLRYSLPPVDWRLRRERVPVRRFMPLLRFAFFNLRNHRKIMVVDGAIGFTGGMNIRRHCVLGDDPPHPTRDLHFRVEGPVVAQLQEVFAEDWAFSGGEALDGDAFFPDLRAVGPSLCRGIADGPDERIGQMPWTFAGAIACAQRSLRVVTPYFLPQPGLADALNVAAMRGVQVDVLIPERGNLPLVTWATWAQLHAVTGRGCRVFLGPPPFDHSKALVVDEQWVLFGSPNWDARSLRLNFELAVECYDAEVARAVADLVDERIGESRLLRRADLDDRALWRKLRDASARLLMPYL